MNRYLVTAPIPDAYAYWRVVDTQSEIMPNFGVAEFYKGMPLADIEAHALCNRLNLIGSCKIPSNNP